MAYVFDTLGQGLADLFVYPARDIDAGEGAVDGQDAVETTAFALFDEIGAVAGFGCDLVGYGGKGVPVFSGVGTARLSCKRQFLDVDPWGSKVRQTHLSIVPNRRTFGLVAEDMAMAKSDSN